jgi:transcription-repair coupling factor (superfamily II helicase)
MDSPPEAVAASDRIGALERLAAGEAVVVATAESALERLLPVEALLASRIELRAGPCEAPGAVLERLLRIGYEAHDPVRLPGQACARGGLLDVFPVGADRPVRAEWFGDEVEGLREFDPMTQRSLGPVSSASFVAARETLIPAERAMALELAERALEREASRLGPEAATLRRLVGADLEAIRAGRPFDRLDLYRPWLYPDSGCVLDVLTDSGLAVLDEPFELHAAAEKAEGELADALAARAARGETLSAHASDFVAPPERLGEGPLVALNASDASPSWCAPGALHDLGAKPLTAYRAQGAALARAVQGWRDSDLLVAVATDQPTRATAMLAQVGIHPSPDAVPGTVHLVEGNLAGGFVCAGAGLAVLSDLELFGVGRLRLAQRKFNEGVPIATVLDLKPGDFVVHIHFGVGVFRGLVRKESEGVSREFLQIDYHPPDRLFVPADQLDRVQKSVAPEDSPPKINRLVGNDWKKAVGKARDEARALARELVRLYAERASVSRPGTGPDTPELLEFEATFPWAETPSQLSAIADVKKDLEAPCPMDRLVCGDVGFGKTEVALRAAFKVAQAGRQVAVLCPTTILSEQHYRSFAERFAGHPYRVEYLNRYRTAGERAEVKRGLADGSVHVVVGTHALLGDKLDFRDLGLLVVDEEQKFGVKHKEALKKLRSTVDVLTLSATPIPRTLNQAFMSIRPISLIEDPPPGRLAVRSQVRPYATEVVREALLRELARGGQAYYVYNKVEGIHHVAERVRQLVPSARVAVGHGQMTEKEIEPVMLGFIAGEIDVLVSTSIVESGLDIPNANTLIVENADRFGLSQLYQLRGRVGRSDVQAYAYFLYAGAKELTENALSRLRALQEFGSLGSGYGLAFRDLQIRGAGELLGAKQSGQIAAVGFDLYTRLIESEVAFLRSFAESERPAAYDDPLVGLEPLPACDLPLQAFIPDDYIEDQGQRLHWYREATLCRSPDAVRTLAAEVQDRYGRLPAPVEAMFEVLRLRLACQEAGLERISADSTAVTLHFSDAGGPSERVRGLLSQRSGAKVGPGRASWRYEGDPVAAARKALDSLAEAERLVEQHRAMLSG